MARLRIVASGLTVASIVLACLPVAASMAGEPPILLAQAQPSQQDPGPAARPGGGTFPTTPSLPAPSTTPRPGLPSAASERVQPPPYFDRPVASVRGDGMRRAGSRRLARQAAMRRLARTAYAARSMWVRRCYPVGVRSFRPVAVTRFRTMTCRCVPICR